MYTSIHLLLLIPLIPNYILLEVVHECVFCCESCVLFFVFEIVFCVLIPTSLLCCSCHGILLCVVLCMMFHSTSHCYHWITDYTRTFPTRLYHSNHIDYVYPPTHNRLHHWLCTHVYTCIEYMTEVCILVMSFTPTPLKLEKL